MRRAEIVALTKSHIKINEDSLIVDVPPTKTQKKRSFMLPEHSDPRLCPVKYLTKYLQIRKDKGHSRMFLRITSKNGVDQVFNSPLGIHTIAKYPTEIAKYLNLANPSLYTGHTFRRTSATLVAEEGASLVQIKRLGGWKSTSVAEGYIDNTNRSRRQIANLISNDTGSNETRYYNPIIEILTQQKDLDQIKNINPNQTNQTVNPPFAQSSNSTGKIGPTAQKDNPAQKEVKKTQIFKNKY